ncbi:hypothetical protein AB0W27_00255 [Aliarcobacter butzleri]|uniref:hypothetical protein n=1 Tax=Aliarcobacter butzleri TaxID=28197 RepID=UPI00125FB1D4|nr:hypothetical protein [Aliarcobacter butzleri]MCG3686108.1 hypothetical protein [Aliarcobacter butzleri]MDN5089473.1 hypothetical protein [Aliarcobacter butzleri]
MESVKSWVYKSDLFSVQNDKISLLAIIETSIMIILTIYAWGWQNFYLPLYIGLVIAPFLLLKTDKSIQEALILFDKYFHLVDVKYNKYLSYFFMLLFYSVIGYIVYNIEGFVIGLFLVLLCIVFLEITEKHKNIFSSVFAFFELVPAVIWNQIMLAIFAIFIKIYATIKYFSLESIKAIPENWKRIVFEVDIFYPPELLPEIESSNLENLSSFKSTNLLIVLKLDISAPNKIFVILNYLIFLIPSIIYRYSFKATALIYIPIIWLIPSKNIPLKLIMKEYTRTLLSKIMFFYSLFVVFFLTIIPFYLYIKSIKILNYLPKIINEKIYKIFFVIDFNFWHLTRFIASVLTIIIFICFEKTLLHLKEDNNYGYKNIAHFCLLLDKFRKIFAFFTLLCTLYLFYINTDVPSGFFMDIFRNMKLVPW